MRATIIRGSARMVVVCGNPEASDHDHPVKARNDRSSGIPTSMRCNLAYFPLPRCAPGLGICLITSEFFISAASAAAPAFTLADTWRTVDNSRRSLRIIAQRRSAVSPEICDRAALIHLNHVASNTPNPSTDAG